MGRYRYLLHQRREDYDLDGYRGIGAKYSVFLYDMQVYST